MAACILALAGCRETQLQAQSSAGTTPAGIRPADEDAEPPGRAFACEDYAAGKKRFRCAFCEDAPRLPKVCPGDDSCVFQSNTVMVVKNGSDHFWRIEDGRACDVRDRIEAIQSALQAEGLAPRVDASCEVVDWAPTAFGADEQWKTVKVSHDPTLPPPRALTREEAYREIYAAYARVLGEQSAKDWQKWADPPFTDDEIARMTGTTFVQPTLRVVESQADDRVPKRARVFLLYSPESSRMYTFDASYSAQRDEVRRGQFRLPESLVDFERERSAPLVRMLRGLDIGSVRFPVQAACDIPDELGGRRWYPLDLEPSGGQGDPSAERLDDAR